MTQRIPPTSPGQGPRSPDPHSLSTTEEGMRPNTDLSSHPTLISHELNE